MDLGINVLMIVVSIVLLVLAGVIVIFAVRVLYHLDLSQKMIRDLGTQYALSHERLVTSIKADLVVLQQHSLERLQASGSPPPPPQHNGLPGSSMIEMQPPMDPMGGLDFGGQ